MSLSSNKADMLKDVLVEVAEVKNGSGAPPWANASQPLPRHVLVYIDSGEGELAAGKQPELLSRNALFVLQPGTVAEMHLLGRNPRIYWVSFDLFRLSESSLSFRSFERILDFPVQGRLRVSGSRFKRFFQALEHELKQETAQTRFACAQLLRDFLHSLLRSAGTESAGDKDTLDRLKQSVQYMRLHYRENLRIDKLAELAQLHPTYYAQLFKQTMRQTPIAFLSQLRMNKAKELLLQTDKNVRQIAREVGYEDEFYFSRRFKAYTGIAPSAYPDRRSLRIVSLSAPYTDHLLALGILPSAGQTHPFLPSDLTELSLPQHATDPWETTRATFIGLQPDLILCKDNVQSRARELLGDIAPVICIPWASQDLYSHLREIAKLVNRQAEAEQWIREYEQRAEQLRAEVHSSIGQASVAICVVRETGLRMYGERNVGHVFYRSLGLTPPQLLSKQMAPYPAGTQLTWTAISPDELPDYDADYLLIAVSDQEERSRIELLLRENKAWGRHTAVSNGTVAFIDWPRWKVYAPHGIKLQLEEAASLLIQMAGGRRHNHNPKIIHAPHAE